MYEFLNAGLLPGTLGLLLAGLVLGLAVLYTRRSRMARIWLWALVAGYFVLSMPRGACLVESAVSAGLSPLEPSGPTPQIGAIVVLDGGALRVSREGAYAAIPVRASVERAMEAVRVYRMTNAPLVVVTGGAYRTEPGPPEGAALRDLLVARGIPPDRIVLDAESRSTHEHAMTVPRLLSSRGVTRFALVTSSVHMRRALLAFKSSGLAIVPAPSPVYCGESLPWWPNSLALERSSQAIHEVAGMIYYWARAWF